MMHFMAGLMTLTYDLQLHLLQWIAGAPPNLNWLCCLIKSEIPNVANRSNPIQYHHAVSSEQPPERLVLSYSSSPAAPCERRSDGQQPWPL